MGVPPIDGPPPPYGDNLQTLRGSSSQFEKTLVVTQKMFKNTGDIMDI